MKKCTKCGIDRNLSDFYPHKNSKDGLTYHCKMCQGKYSSNWQKNNREKRAEAKKRWRLKNPSKVMEGELRRSFGITLSLYNQMLNNQNDRCAICNTDKSQFNRRLSVDHDHKTDKIRGLLCDNCNHIIGQAKDNIEILKSAIQYLQDHNA